MSSRKKTPSNKRKKVTASVRAQISTRKVNRQSIEHLGESYIQQSTPTDVSTVPQTQNPDPALPHGDPSAPIISMLNKLSESNQALLARVESIEERQNSVNFHTHLMSGSGTSSHRDPVLISDVTLGCQMSRTYIPMHHLPGGSRVSFPTLPRAQTHPQGITTGVNGHLVSQSAVRSDIQSDGVVPTLETLRRTPSIANSVTQLLESYEEQARASLHGRQARKSGRYNTTDIVCTIPE